MSDLEQAAAEWLSARARVTAEGIADVRFSESFRVALNRLAEAEDALAKAARPITPTCPFCNKPHAGSLPCRHCGEPDIPTPDDD